MTSALTAAAALLGAAVGLSLLGWWRRVSRWAAAAATLALGGAAGAAALSPGLDPSHEHSVGLVALGAGLAVLGGGPLTTTVFTLVDGPGAHHAGSVRRAAEVLRGGAWIGALERIAVFGSIASGWPEGIAITLALKGLGRYPELRHEERTGIAERFLIGTFLSVLWAAACAGTVLLLVR